MRHLRIKPQARLDLLEIWNHIAEDNVPAAIRVGEALDKGIHGISKMPGKGHRRADVREERYRFWSVHSYVIAFRYDADTVTIVRVVHGRRDFRRLFLA